MKKLEEEIKRWKKRVNIILIITPITFALGFLDTLNFKNTGTSIVHPYLDVLLVMGSFGLFSIVLAARLRWYLLNKNKNKS